MEQKLPIAPLSDLTPPGFGGRRSRDRTRRNGSKQSCHERGKTKEGSQTCCAPSLRTTSQIFTAQACESWSSRTSSASTFRSIWTDVTPPLGKIESYLVRVISPRAEMALSWQPKVW